MMTTSPTQEFSTLNTMAADINRNPSKIYLDGSILRFRTHVPNFATTSLKFYFKCPY